MISTASRRVADERFEFVDVGGGEAVHGREPVATVLQSLREGPRVMLGARPASVTQRFGRCSSGLASRAAGAGTSQALRVALSRRLAAHGHQRVRALPQTRPPCHQRPLQPGPRHEDGVDVVHAIVE
jgi:hypothetical protein